MYREPIEALRRRLDFLDLDPTVVYAEQVDGTTVDSPPYRPLRGISR